MLKRRKQFVLRIHSIALGMHYGFSTKQHTMRTLSGESMHRVRMDSLPRTWIAPTFKKTQLWRGNFIAKFHDLPKCTCNPKLSIKQNSSSSLDRPLGWAECLNGYTFAHSRPRFEKAIQESRVKGWLPKS